MQKQLILNYDIERQMKGVMKIYELLKSKGIAAPRGVTLRVQGSDYGLHFAVSVDNARFTRVPLCMRYDINNPHSEWAVEEAETMAISGGYNLKEVIANFKWLEDMLTSGIVVNGALSADANNILNYHYDGGGVSVRGQLINNKLVYAYEVNPSIGLSLKNDSSF